MGDARPFRISVPATTPGVTPRAATDPQRTVIVLVEPLYLGVAAALALDAGWGSVELAPRGEDPLIPLVSFEQRPTARGGRCRVRGDVADIDAAREPASVVLLASLTNARPLASRLATTDVEFVEFVPVASDGRLSADAWAASGTLLRLFVEEAERVCLLDDAAGLAVSLASEPAGISSALTVGARWSRHLELGGSEDDLRIASALDSVGVVPRLDAGADGTLIATEW